MCMTCGCHEPVSRHPGARSIVWSDLQAAAADAGVDPVTAAKNIVDAAEQMTGAIVKADQADRFLLMVGYSPNRLPKRGADGYLDLASPEVIEKACWRFMENGAGAGLMHKAGGEQAFRVVENSVYRNDEPWVLTAPDGSTQTIRKGDWLIGVICTPETWAGYERGEYGSGSLQGSAKRAPARPQTIANQRSD